MIAHCLETEHKLLCDFFITLTLRNQCENLNLAFREFREDLGWCGGSDIGEETNQPLGNARAKDRFAVRNRARTQRITSQNVLASLSADNRSGANYSSAE